MATIDTVKGKITGYDERRGVVKIEAPYSDFATMCRREYKEVDITFQDSRPLSPLQRRNCYAMIRDIAEWSGHTAESIKGFTKLSFWRDELSQTADTLFSLSDAPMSIVAAFQKWLARFIVENDVPTRKPMLDYVDDIQDYVYACTINKKCPICGQMADLHHVSAIGMGRDRTEIIHEGLEVMPLCREHHTQIHSLGREGFMAMYHLNGGVICDKTICRIYGLKRRRQGGKSADG